GRRGGRYDGGTGRARPEPRPREPPCPPTPPPLPPRRPARPRRPHRRPARAPPSCCGSSTWPAPPTKGLWSFGATVRGHVYGGLEGAPAGSDLEGDEALEVFFPRARARPTRRGR